MHSKIVYWLIQLKNLEGLPVSVECFIDAAISKLNKPWFPILSDNIHNNHTNVIKI